MSRKARVPAAASLTAAALLASSGCIAASARVHVGAVTTGERTGVQVGAVFGIGLTRSHRSAIIAASGFVTGNAPTAGLESNVEYVRFPDRDDDLPIVLRGGYGGTVALAGAPGLLGGEGAAVFIVRDRHGSTEPHEKLGGGGWSRSVLGVGVEARAGLAYTNTKDDDGMVIDTRFEPGGAVSLTLEYLMIGEANLF